ncbi:MAG: hypothetical protein KDA44_14970 [Planctomycetales bacterium]|nr:hypothetical protein [Planctomycetales bacterium]
MFRRHSSRIVLLLSLAAAVGATPRAATAQPVAKSAAPAVLAHLPDDALGFVLLRDLTDADAKTQQLLDMFDMKAPAPLALLKFATGLGEGLDASGDLLVAFLPAARNQPALIPLVLAPVDDYAEFVAPVGGDETGEICRITIGGEDVLVARDGDFAMLMNVEHRETMELLIGAEPEAVATLEPLEEWLVGNQVSAVIMPTGAELLLAMGEQGLAAQRAETEANLADEEFAEVLAEARQGLEMMEMMLGGVRNELRAFAVGVSLDDAMNLRLSSRMLLTEQSHIASLARIERRENGLLGYADEPFVGVVEGMLPAELAAYATGLYQRMIAASPEDFGLGEMDEAEWQEFAKTQELFYKGMQGYSMLMLPGDKDDPIVTQLYGVVLTDDSAQLLDNWQKSIEATNSLMARFDTELDFEYGLERRTIAGKPALDVTVDMAQLMKDENVPQMETFVKALFGDDGVFTNHIVAANDHVVISAVASEGRVADLIAAVNQGELGLATSEPVQTTEKLLDPQSPWRALVSPQGCVTWAERVVAKFLENVGAFMTPPDFPEFAATAPVGVSLRVTNGQLAAECVWPSETLAGLAEYVQKVNEMK